MQRKDFNEYLSRFNSRDYDGLLEYWADEFDADFLGSIKLKNHQELKEFYAFLHEFIDEEIIVHKFVSDEHMVAIEVTAKFIGIKDLSKQTCIERGFANAYPITKGQKVLSPQFIHYDIKDGKFTGVRVVFSSESM